MVSDGRLFQPTIIFNGEFLGLALVLDVKIGFSKHFTNNYTIYYEGTCSFSAHSPKINISG